MSKNQDNGLFTLDIEDIKPEPKKGRGRWPGKNPNPENKPIDNSDSGTVSANINKLDDIDKGVLCVNDIDINEIGKNGENKGKESPFNRKELIFLEYYLILKESMTNAMKLSGYENYSDQHLRYLGRKIVYRYETWAGDARIVFRKSGTGEVRLARTVDKLLKSQNEKTLLGAAELTAKVLRAAQDPGETRQGISIVINTSAPCVSGPGLPCPPDAGPVVEVRVTADHKPLKPLAITK